MVPRLQGSDAQPPWLLVTSARVKSLGRVSVTVTLSASDGPVLVTRMV